MGASVDRSKCRQEQVTRKEMGHSSQMEITDPNQICTEMTFFLFCYTTLGWWSRN